LESEIAKFLDIEMIGTEKNKSTEGVAVLHSCNLRRLRQENCKLEVDWGIW
jgi:hypothetical protein